MLKTLYKFIIVPVAIERITGTQGRIRMSRKNQYQTVRQVKASHRAENAMINRLDKEAKQDRVLILFTEEYRKKHTPRGA